MSKPVAESKKEKPNPVSISGIKKTSAIPNLSSIQKDLAEKKKDENGAKLTFGNNPVTPDELLAQWKVFVDKLKSDGRDREYNTLNQKVEVDEELTIHLLLPNSFQTRTIEDLQQELLTYLRTKFDNGKISLVTEVEKFEEKKLIYTNSEKFEYLTQKYPDLRKLKQRLDLDTDF